MPPSASEACGLAVGVVWSRGAVDVGDVDVAGVGVPDLSQVGVESQWGLLVWGWVGFLMELVSAVTVSSRASWWGRRLTFPLFFLRFVLFRSRFLFFY